MQTLRILVIDDAALVRDFIRQGLYVVLSQIEIVEAFNGRRAQSLLETKPIDLVLCDWEMPDVDGQALLLWIRAHERLHNTPFIMVTVRGERNHVVAAMRAGIDGYVVKPFSIDTLAKQIRGVLAKRGINLGTIPALTLPTTSTLQQDAAFVSARILPDTLPPFDLATVVARMANKPELVRKTLVRFHDSFGNAPAELDRLMTEGKRDELLRLAHTIRGIAATLEASALTTAAATLEETLLQGNTREVETLVEALKTALLPALTAAGQVSS